MAVTGLIFIGYVLLHMYGNLKVLAGQEAFDTYAHHLRTFGEPILPYGGLLWIVRIVLIAAIIGHAYSAFTLWSRANAARSSRYAVKRAAVASLGSQTMRWGGVALLLFIAFHLLHFTTHTVRPAGSFDSPYAMVVENFQIWWVVVIYLAALVALGLHLAHGTFSAQQTLGWTQTAAAYTRAKAIAHGVAAVVIVGFAIPPLAIAFGVVG